MIKNLFIAGVILGLSTVFTWDCHASLHASGGDFEQHTKCEDFTVSYSNGTYDDIVLNQGLLEAFKKYTYGIGQKRKTEIAVQQQNNESAQKSNAGEMSENKNEADKDDNGAIDKWWREKGNPKVEGKGTIKRGDNYTEVGCNPGSVCCAIQAMTRNLQETPKAKAKREQQEKVQKELKVRNASGVVSTIQPKTGYGYSKVKNPDGSYDITRTPAGVRIKDYEYLSDMAKIKAGKMVGNPIHLAVRAGMAVWTDNQLLGIKQSGIKSPYTMCCLLKPKKNKKGDNTDKEMSDQEAFDQWESGKPAKKLKWESAHYAAKFDGAVFGQKGVWSSGGWHTWSPDWYGYEEKDKGEGKDKEKNSGEKKSPFDIYPPDKAPPSKPPGAQRFLPPEAPHNLGFLDPDEGQPSGPAIYAVLVTDTPPISPKQAAERDGEILESEATSAQKAAAEKEVEKVVADLKAQGEDPWDCDAVKMLESLNARYPEGKADDEDPSEKYNCSSYKEGQEDQNAADQADNHEEAAKKARQIYK